ncbi:glycosyltransferase [Alloyangia pacifica]|uniref:glycosyltransferase n=1 Tax=Alloyangia pacifica TaxID=311180 RepID=UPI001CD39C13|nr:glycosyltransferase family 4 protein [Alloyangia pacifica]MCA0997317.1 glycosyltransferase family 4 protein [Alloyangia pacifica]
MPRRRATLIVARRLDAMGEGSNSYLKPYLTLCQEAGLSTRLLFAPRRSFGNRAWARLHPDFAARVDSVDWPQTIRLGDVWISLSPEVWVRCFRRAGAEALRRLRRKTKISHPSALGVELSERETRDVARRASAEPIDLLTVEYSSLGPLLDRIDAAKRIVFLHDLFSLRAKSFQEAGLEPDHAAITVEQEAERCSAADVLIHASCTELAQFRPMLASAKHIWMRPEVIAVREKGDPSAAPHGVFLGSQHAGNIAALAFLRERVWPRVRAQVPDAELWIAGSICARIEPAAARAEGLRLLGRVDDLAVLGGKQAVGLAPMLLGSGIPIKVADYLALGMPVAVTPHVLAPFGNALEGLVREAATEAEYPNEICKILTSDKIRQEMSIRSSEVSARLSNEVVLSEVADHAFEWRSKSSKSPRNMSEYRQS